MTYSWDEIQNKLQKAILLRINAKWKQLYYTSVIVIGRILSLEK